MIATVGGHERRRLPQSRGRLRDRRRGRQDHPRLPTQSQRAVTPVARRPAPVARRGRIGRRPRDRADPSRSGLLRRRRPQGACLGRQCPGRFVTVRQRPRAPDGCNVSHHRSRQRCRPGRRHRADGVVRPRRRPRLDDVRAHRGAHRCRPGDHRGPDPASGASEPDRCRHAHRGGLRRPLRPWDGPRHPRERRRGVDRRRPLRRHPPGLAHRRRGDQAAAAHGRIDGAQTLPSMPWPSLSNELFNGADAAEGMAAFAEKRRPSWSRSVQ
jgi:hypothetical protein